MSELPVNLEAELDDLLCHYRGLKRAEAQTAAAIAAQKAKIEAVLDRERILADEPIVLSTGDRITRVRGKRSSTDAKALVKKGYITTAQLAEVTTVREQTPYWLITLSEDV